MGRSRSSSIQQMRRWAMISGVVVASLFNRHPWISLVDSATVFSYQVDHLGIQPTWGANRVAILIQRGKAITTQ